MLMYASIALFVIGVVIALALVEKHLRSKPVSIPSALLHGGFVASGLVLFVVSSLRGGFTPINTASLILFVLAALGGVALFVLHLKGRRLPPALIFLHALLAVSGFILMLLYVFKPAA